MSKLYIHKVTSRGLTPHGDTLLSLLFAGRQVFPEQDWCYAKNENIGSCAAIILDTESEVGKSLWKDLEDAERSPVRIAYTSSPAELEQGQGVFALKKPCRSHELATVMGKVRAYLDAEVCAGGESSQASPTTESARAPEASVEASGPVEPDPAPASGHQGAMEEATQAQLSDGLSMIDRFRLIRWPNFRALNYTPRHVKLAVLISREAADVLTLAKSCGLTLSDTISFVNACYEMGYLQVVNSSEASVSVGEVRLAGALGASVTPGDDPVRSRKLSFLRKIRNRLGL